MPLILLTLLAVACSRSSGGGAERWPDLPEPEVVSAAELAAENPPLAEPVLGFCRRGSFALVAGDPKAGKTTFALRVCAKKATEGRTCLYADFENGPALFWHRLQKFGGAANLANIHYLDCRYSPSIDYIASAMRAMGGVDVLVIDCWGLLVAGDGVEDESSNALVSAYFLRVRRALSEFDAATVILHHTPKSGANEKLCFAGCSVCESIFRHVPFSIHGSIRTIFAVSRLSARNGAISSCFRTDG